MEAPFGLILSPFGNVLQDVRGVDALATLAAIARQIGTVDSNP